MAADIENANDKDKNTWTEHIEVAGSALSDRVKELISEGNVRRLIIKSPSDDVLMEIPLSAGIAVGAAATIFSPVLTALAAMATMLSRVHIEVVRSENQGERSTDA